MKAKDIRLKRMRCVLLPLAAALLLAPAVSSAQEDEASLAARGLPPSASPEKATLVWTDRADLESQVLARWRGVPTRSTHGRDPGELALAVAAASEARLVRAATAKDADSFVSRLAGTRTAGAVTYSGGTPIPDLTFVPVAPCRIFDTRSATAGKMVANETRGFYTNSVASLAAFTGQGGNVSGCPEVPFDPPAVLINFTVANPEAKGNARVWDYFGSEPVASTINFQAGINLANGTASPACFSCGPDISVKVTQNVHVLADIVGYFRAKDKTLDLNILGALFDGASGTGIGIGLVFADGAFSSFRTSVFLPQDFSAQTDVTARFLLSIPDTGCAINWSANSPIRVLRPGSGTANVLSSNPESAIVTVPATGGNIFSTATILSSSDIVAGDLLTLSWFRSTTGDTCTSSLTLRGVQLIYE
jgi:hypothetical protein